MSRQLYLAQFGILGWPETGSGDVFGTVLGTVAITVLYNGLATMNVGSNYILVIQGLMLIVIVAAYAWRDRRKVASD